MGQLTEGEEALGDKDSQGKRTVDRKIEEELTMSWEMEITEKKEILEGIKPKEKMTRKGHFLC